MTSFRIETGTLGSCGTDSHLQGPWMPCHLQMAIWNFVPSSMLEVGSADTWVDVVLPLIFLGWHLRYEGPGLLAILGGLDLLGEVVCLQRSVVP